MMMKHRRCLAALLAASLLLLSGCGSSSDEASDTDSGALIWETWGGYSAHQKFLELAKEKYPDIELEFISYTGGNRTGYSWAQMRAGDIPDIFITSGSDLFGRRGLSSARQLCHVRDLLQ